jgi:hypothetical protein
VLEAHPDWVVLKPDIKNFYKAIWHMALTTHKQGIADGNIGMEKDFMLHYNLSVHEAPIYGSGGQRLRFNSSMGGQQGCAMSTRTQCLHLRRIMDEINEEIQGEGGIIAGDMDGVVVGGRI